MCWKFHVSKIFQLKIAIEVVDLPIDSMVIFPAHQALFSSFIDSDPSPMDSTPATFKGPSMAPWFLANAFDARLKAWLKSWLKPGMAWCVCV